jgi:hypothetical protein
MKAQSILISAIMLATGADAAVKLNQYASLNDW